MYTAYIWNWSTKKYYVMRHHSTQKFKIIFDKIEMFNSVYIIYKLYRSFLIKTVAN